MSEQPVTLLLRRLWNHTSRRRRLQFALLLVLMVCASLAEILSIGAVLPFLAILTNPARVYAHTSAQPIIQAMSLTEPHQLLLPLTIAFGLAALFAGAIRLLLLWASIRLSYAAGADLSISIYRRTLYQPYAVHVARNSSEIIDGISGKTGNAIYIINMTLNLISCSVMLIAILIALLCIDPFIAPALQTAELAQSQFCLEIRQKQYFLRWCCQRERWLAAHVQYGLAKRGDFRL